MRHADGVEVPGKMQIDVFHRYDLRIATAGSAAFHAEAGAQGRLAQADNGFLTQAIQRIAQADRGSRFAFAGRGGANRSD